MGIPLIIIHYTRVFLINHPCLGFSYGFPMVFLWFFYGFSTVFLWFGGTPFKRLKGTIYLPYDFSARFGSQRFDEGACRQRRNTARAACRQDTAKMGFQQGNERVDL